MKVLKMKSHYKLKRVKFVLLYHLKFLIFEFLPYILSFKMNFQNLAIVFAPTVVQKKVLILLKFEMITLVIFLIILCN